MGFLICLKNNKAVFVSEKRKLEEDRGIWRFWTRRWKQSLKNLNYQ
jgi:hypothetical protein